MLLGIPRAEWDSQTVGEVMQRELADISIRPDADARAALEQMQRVNSARLLVVEGKRLVGILSLRGLLGFLASNFPPGGR
jgi:CBS domain-containing protein